MYHSLLFNNFNTILEKSFVNWQKFTVKLYAVLRDIKSYTSFSRM